MHEFAMPSDSAATKYTFGPFELDTASRSFSRGGQAVALAPKTFDTLLLLVENQGRVLTKAQMMSALWPDIFVEEANLSYQISTLRKAMGEQAAWIETSPKVGYRFIGPVQQASTAPVEVIVPPRPAHSPLVIVAFAGALTALGLIVGWLGWNRNHDKPMPPSEPVPLTSYDGIEDDPSFSSDGSQ